MNQSELLEKFRDLNPKAKEEVYEFIDFIIYKYSHKQTPKTIKKTHLSKEPFFGMWADRPEMKDSVSYVKKLRNKQWNRKK